MATRLPTYAISHGGGPWPWMKDLLPIDTTPLEAALESIPAELDETPTAILVITAHWEAPVFTVQTNPRPPMVYDYGGFPPETYEIQYPAPGHPAVAHRVTQLLTEAGIPNAQDPARGFDHGTFVPLYVMYPEADVPIVQMSVVSSLDPEAHLAAGRALAPLRDEGVLIVASGVPTFHNLSPTAGGSVEPSRAFDAWLTETVVDNVGAERSERLANWDQAPAARLAHRREEHFVPLLVAVGAAEDDPGVRNYHEQVMMGGGFTSSAYRVGHVTTKPARQDVLTAAR